MNALKNKLLAVTALTLLAAPAYAQDNDNTLGIYDDESPIVLSGTVSAIDDDEFTMAYDGGDVKVEMDDWDWFDNDETRALNIGDEVVVSGQIDDDLFEGREIEADTVYLVSDASYYYGDQQTEQPVYYFYTFDQQNRQNQQNNQQTAQNNAAEGTGSPMQNQSWVSAVGTVKNVGDEKMTLDAGRYNLVVDIEQAMGEQPRNINVGEKVYVAGMLDQDFFNNREISANRIVTLSQDRSRADTASQRQQERQQREQQMQQTPAN